MIPYVLHDKYFCLIGTTVTLLAFTAIIMSITSTCLTTSSSFNLVSRHVLKKYNCEFPTTTWNLQFDRSSATAYMLTKSSTLISTRVKSFSVYPSGHKLKPTRTPPPPTHVHFRSLHEGDYSHKSLSLQSVSKQHQVSCWTCYFQTPSWSGLHLEARVSISLLRK